MAVIDKTRSVLLADVGQPDYGAASILAGDEEHLALIQLGFHGPGQRCRVPRSRMSSWGRCHRAGCSGPLSRLRAVAGQRRAVALVVCTFPRPDKPAATTAPKPPTRHGERKCAHE